MNTASSDLVAPTLAWTGHGDYPPYVNLTGNRLRVRGAASHGRVMDDIGWIEGPYAFIDLPDDVIADLRQAARILALETEVAELRTYNRRQYTRACEADCKSVRLERDKAALVEALNWLAMFADIRSQDNSKVFARVNRGALRTIRDRSRATLAKHGGDK